MLYSAFFINCLVAWVVENIYCVVFACASVWTEPAVSDVEFEACCFIRNNCFVDCEGLAVSWPVAGTNAYTFGFSGSCQLNISACAAVPVVKPVIVLLALFFNVAYNTNFYLLSGGFRSFLYGEYLAAGCNTNSININIFLFIIIILPSVLYTLIPDPQGSSLLIALSINSYFFSRR